MFKMHTKVFKKNCKHISVSAFISSTHVPTPPTPHITHIYLNDLATCYDSMRGLQVFLEIICLVDMDREGDIFILS